MLGLYFACRLYSRLKNSFCRGDIMKSFNSAKRESRNQISSRVFGYFIDCLGEVAFVQFYNTNDSKCVHTDAVYASRSNRFELSILLLVSSLREANWNAVRDTVHLLPPEVGIPGLCGRTSGIQSANVSACVHCVLTHFFFGAIAYSQRSTHTHALASRPMQGGKKRNFLFFARMMFNWRHARLVW